MYYTGTLSVLRTVVVRCKGKYTGTAADYLADYISMPNHDRCSVLMDESFVLTSQTDTIRFHRKLKLNGKQLAFTGTAAGDDQDGQIICITVAAADYANDPIALTISRLWFKDQ